MHIHFACISPVFSCWVTFNVATVENATAENIKETSSHSDNNSLSLGLGIGLPVAAIIMFITAGIIYYKR